jgi:hypothetical protein
LAFSEHMTSKLHIKCCQATLNTATLDEQSF